MNDTPTSPGFFWCKHCSSVVDLPDRVVDAALDAPAGSNEHIQCPKCRQRAVRWRFASKPKPKPIPAAHRPVSAERGRELWAWVKENLNLI